MKNEATQGIEFNQSFLQDSMQELKDYSSVIEKEFNLRTNEAIGAAMQFINNITLCNFWGDILTRLESIESLIEEKR